jgi:hypothetical protein
MAKHDEKQKKTSGRTHKKDSGKHKKVPSSARVKKATPPPEDDDDDFASVDDPAAAFLDTAVKSTPWWSLSLAFHGIVLACLPLIVFSHKLLHDDTSTITIAVKPTQVARIPMDERPRGIVDSTGIPGDDKPTTDQPRINFPEAEKSTHNESADGEDYGQMKGDSMNALSYIPGTEGGVKGRMPGAGPGTNDSMGVGGGSGGSSRFGGRFGGRKNLVATGGGTPATESAVEAGLRWLSRHQSPDGHWDSVNYCKECKGTPCDGVGISDFDTGLTGLALLAFLGAGITPQNRSVYVDQVTGKQIRRGDVVRNGLRWLVEHQHDDGSIGPQVGEMMYNHAIAALALTEAYGITNAVAYRAPAQKAVNFIQAAQTPYLAWRYQPRVDKDDTSVTGWCVMALKSAQISGLEVSQVSFQGAKQWINQVTETESGQVGYDHLGSGPVYAREADNDKWQHHHSMSAVGLLCRIFIDKKKGDPFMEKEARLVTTDLPKWDPHGKEPTVDYYYWYYGTLALFQFDGPTGPMWKKWNSCMKDALCKNQKARTDGCKDGSWDTNGVDRWGFFGGRIYGTAINVLTLEVYYRYELAFGSKRS